MIDLIEDRVLIKPYETKRSPIITLDVSKQPPYRGVVISAGKGREVDGKLIPMTYKEGDEVAFNYELAQTIHLDRVEHLIIREYNIEGKY